MKITICGSMHHITAMKEAAGILENLGYEIDTPNPREGEVPYDTLPDKERGELKDSLIREHLDKISDSDAVFIFNEEKKGVPGYIGGNTLMEMAFAYQQGLEIFLFQPVPDMNYADEIFGMRPIILNGKTEKIHEYFQSLPKTYVSSKSPIKLRAVSRGMRRAGMRTQVIAHPTESGVSDQPKNIEETYQGAMNRHEALRKAVGTMADYFATSESGNHPVHPEHNDFSSTVIILEKAGGERKVGMNIELEFPKEMTGKVPGIYPDLGVLAQEEYGSSLKDPFPFFTNGKINRLQLVETAVFNVAAQLVNEKSAI